MNLSEAKATSRLLHALAGDTDLDPVTAAAVIETLSFAAGAVLEVTRVLSGPGVQVAVERATAHPGRPRQVTEEFPLRQGFMSAAVTDTPRRTSRRGL